MHFEAPNAEQKRWRDQIGEQASILSGYRPIQIHHVIGRTAKIKGIGNIGHLFILPLCKEEHYWIDWGNNGLKLMKERYLSYHGIEDSEKISDMNLLEIQKFLFGKLCRQLKPNFGKEFYDEILRWHR